MANTSEIRRLRNMANPRDRSRDFVRTSKKRETWSREYQTIASRVITLFSEREFDT